MLLLGLAMGFDFQASSIAVMERLNAVGHPCSSCVAYLACRLLRSAWYWPVQRPTEVPCTECISR